MTKTDLAQAVKKTAYLEIKAAETLKQVGTQVVKIAAVLDRQEGAAAKISQVDPFEVLFTSTDLGIAVTK